MIALHKYSFLYSYNISDAREKNITLDDINTLEPHNKFKKLLINR